MDEVSPFIETVNDRVSGGAVGLNSLDMSFVVNVAVVIAIIYLVYVMVCRCVNQDDSDDEEQSYIEEQVELLRMRQKKYL